MIDHRTHYNGILAAFLFEAQGPYSTSYCSYTPRGDPSGKARLRRLQYFRELQWRSIATKPCSLQGKQDLPPSLTSHQLHNLRPST